MKRIEGYERYYVTRCGQIWSDRLKGFLRHGSVGGGRYKSVCLSKKGKAKGYMVHRLVALAYIPNPMNKPEVNHIDGDRMNNSADNLEWVTRKENVQHAIRTGLMAPCTPESTHFKKGYDPKRKMKNKLTKEQVIKIRARNAAGESYRDISYDYDVNESNIRRCCKWQSYKDIM